MTSKGERRAAVHLGRVIHIDGEPDLSEAPAHLTVFDNGCLVVDNQGKIVYAGDRAGMPAGNLPIVDHGRRWLLPGFVDTHVHYPQVDIIACGGLPLLRWLEDHTFAAERRLSDPAVASATAERFLHHLIANGTTTALVFGVSFAAAMDIFFSHALTAGLRVIAGRVAMDEGPPAAQDLLFAAAPGLAADRRLIERWHNAGDGLLQYALQPRFALSVSPELLRLTAEFYAAVRGRGVYLHTHLAEQEAECDAARARFQVQDYIDIWDSRYPGAAGPSLLGRRTVFAHVVWPSARDLSRIAAAGCSIAHCPRSNFFLGSGLFALSRMLAHKITCGLGSDVAAGDSFSLLACANEAYKHAMLQGLPLSGAHLLHLATLGGAQALDLAGCTGNLAVGKDADFVVINPARLPLLQQRLARSDSVVQDLFALFMLGDDRVVTDTYVRGRRLGPGARPGQGGGAA